jgi:NAD(P)-dependent dehydrogenase (short-subunit alcohol dehydrogenase family)
VVNSRHHDEAVGVASQLGRNAFGIGSDIGTPEGVDHLFEALDGRHAQVDIFVNNAGMPMLRDSLELSLDDWHASLAINLTAPLMCSQRAARRMLAGSGGCIINIASIQAFTPFPKRVAYATSKAGLVMMTRVLAAEWAPRVRVNAVAPGFIWTQLVQRIAEEGGIEVDAVNRRTPLQRMGSPEDVAKACVFLASDDASFATGETLVIDGGWLSYGYV